jgi:hypothetical protein
MTANKTNHSTEVVRSINESAKRFFDAVESLRQAAWESFDRRRAFEWKLSFGLWTALALSIAGLAAGQVTFKPDAVAERWFVSAIASIVVVLHGWWSLYLAQVNDADLRKSYIYEREQRLALGISERTKPGEDINRVITLMTGRGWFAKHGGHVTQVAITAILAAGAAALAWLRYVVCALRGA